VEDSPTPSGTTPEQRERLLGAVWGQLVADAFDGRPEAFHPVEIFTRERRGHGSPPLVGAWSSEIGLLLATLDSLLRDSQPDRVRFDPADQATRFAFWGQGLQYRERRKVNGITGVPPEPLAGSLMRVLPLALVERDVSDNELVEHAYEAATGTDGGLIQAATGSLYALVARKLLSGHEWSEALAISERTLRTIYDADPDSTRMVAALDLSIGRIVTPQAGSAFDTFWFAWDAAASAQDYRETLVRALSHGSGDKPMLCIAGGLAGLRWGVDAIPMEWRARVHARGEIFPIFSDLSKGAPMSPAPAGAHTSETDPMRVYRIDGSDAPSDARWTGKLGMTTLPGAKDLESASRQWRDVRTDASQLASKWGLDCLVLLVEDEELVATRTLSIAIDLGGIELIRYRIAEDGVPQDEHFRELIALMDARMRQHKYVTIASREGLGRAGMVFACLLRQAGLDGPEAIELTRRVRPGAIKTAEQEAFVLNWVPTGR
jgi:ADP-ribosyl-[dinitrogen reductase] hydrolase